LKIKKISLRELQLKKMKAVEEEDFDLAQFYKDRIALLLAAANPEEPTEPGETSAENLTINLLSTFRTYIRNTFHL
jgi:excinuclease UvrABC nuclease subunit